MKKRNKNLSAIALATVFALGLGGQVLAAPAAVNLGTATSFAILAGTAITNTPTSTITGDVGLSPAAGSNYAGITTSQVNGTIYSVDGSGPAGSINNPALLTTAKNDLVAAYTDVATRVPTTTFLAGDNQLGGQTLTAGVYAFGHGSTANLTAGSPLTLDGQGDPSSVFIFQASSDLITASGSVVRLINGAQACNVFWQVGSSSGSLGSGSTFVGTILSLTSINADTSATITGRLLARNAAVTTHVNTITRPICATPTPTTTGTTTTGAGSGTTTPALPNTGVGPDRGFSPSSVIAPAAAVLAVSGGAYLARKRWVRF